MVSWQIVNICWVTATIYYYYYHTFPKFLRETRNTNRAMFQCHSWGPGKRNTMLRGQAFVPSRRRITLCLPANTTVNTPCLPLSPKLVQTLTDSSMIRRFHFKGRKGAERQPPAWQRIQEQIWDWVYPAPPFPTPAARGWWGWFLLGGGKDTAYGQALPLKGWRKEVRPFLKRVV